MDENIKELLEEEIKEELRNLSSLDRKSKERSEAIEGLATLHKLRMDEIKNDRDFNDEFDTRECEEQIRKEQVKDRYFKLGIEVAGIVLPLIFYAAWMKRGFKFEETGTYTSTTFRGLFNRFKPTN